MEKIFSVAALSFVTALSGALQPGPLLTFTVIQTLKAPKHAFSLGPKIILGHAFLELLLIIALLLGLGIFIENDIFLKISGIAGSCFLFFLVSITLKDIFFKKNFNQLNGFAEKANTPQNDKAKKTEANFLTPILAGALISMSNPYWWIWWVTIGLIFMREYNISLQSPILAIAFYLGHESADFFWYSFVSLAVSQGKKFISLQLYKIILFCSTLFLLGLAIYLLIATLMKF